MAYLVLGTLYNRFVLGLQGFNQVPRFSFAGMVYHSQQAFEYIKDLLAERSLQLSSNHNPVSATNPVSHQSNVEGMQGMGLGHRERSWRGRPGGSQQQPNPFSHQAQVGLGSSPLPKQQNQGLFVPRLSHPSDVNDYASDADQAGKGSGDDHGKELVNIPALNPSQRPGRRSSLDNGGDIAEARGRGLDSNNSVIRL